MEHEVSAANYKDLVLFLATAGIVAPIFKRLKINTILGYLLAGVILGPFGLGRFIHVAPWLDYVTVDNPDEIAQLAEFGVVFLLFMIGLELSWERLRLMRKLVFGLGAAQVIGCSLVLAAGAMLLGQPPAAALAIGTDYDVALVDFHLGYESTGLDLVAALPPIPAALVTAEPDPALARRAAAKGGALLAKPLDPTTFDTWLATAISG